MNNKKIILLFILFLLSFIIFIYINNKPKDYKITYKINDIKITEEYILKESKYKFIIKNNKYTYKYEFISDYLNKQIIIDNIKYNKKNKCINIDSKYFNFIPQCYDNEYTLIKNNKSKLIDKYKDIEIYNKDYNYYLNTYKSLIYLSDKYKELDIFENDKYIIDNYYMVNNKLILFENDGYKTNNIYILNSDNGKYIKTSDKNMSYDIRILGHHKKYLYVIDNIENIEYEININNGNIDYNNGQLYIDNEKKYESVKNIIKYNMSFDNSTNNSLNYYLKDNTLYLKIDNNSIKVSDKNVNKIIYVNNNSVYYLSEDCLYEYNINNGEKKLLKYYEWNFNNINQIFIFNK